MTLPSSSQRSSSCLLQLFRLLHKSAKKHRTILYESTFTTFRRTIAKELLSLITKANSSVEIGRQRTLSLLHGKYRLIISVRSVHQLLICCPSWAFSTGKEFLRLFFEVEASRAVRSKSRKRSMMKIMLRMLAIAMTMKMSYPSPAWMIGLKRMFWPCKTTRLSKSMRMAQHLKCTDWCGWLCGIQLATREWLGPYRQKKRWKKHFIRNLNAELLTGEYEN